MAQTTALPPPVVKKSVKKDLEQLVSELSVHVPSSGIIDRIKAATKNSSVLEKVRVGQKEARDLFTLNDANRPIHYTRTQLYIQIMKEDKWEFNGDSLCVSKDLKLFNGQKRLLAIIYTGKAQVFNIQCGLDEKAFATIDAGQPHSAGDILSLLGFANQNVMAAVIRGEIYFREHGSVASKISRKAVSVQDVQEWTNNNDMKRLEQCVLKGIEYHAHAKFLSQGAWGTLLYILMGIHRTQAETFCSLLATGENISRQSDPAIYRLREYLLSYEKLQFQKHPLDLKYRYIMRAWNLWRTKEKVDKLKIRITEKWEPIEKPI